MFGPTDAIFGPFDPDSREFQARYQIRRIEYLTGRSESEIICAAIGEYYQRVLAAATEEELQRERRRAGA